MVSLTPFGQRKHGPYRNLNDDLYQQPHGHGKSCLPEVFIFEKLGISQSPDSYTSVSTGLAWCRVSIVTAVLCTNPSQVVIA